MVRWTPADIFALRVDAGAVLAGLRALAFIHVGAVAAGTVELVAFVALAAEHAEDVLAATKNAEITEHLALVDVNARLLVTLIRVYEAHFAFAAISARVVQAMPILAERAVLRTFVDVLAAVTIASKASVAYALQEQFRQRELTPKCLANRQNYKIHRRNIPSHYFLNSEK